MQTSLMVLFSILFALTFQEIPFKPDSEFEIRLDYSFRQKPARDDVTVSFEPISSSSGGQLPFLILHLDVKEANGASRIKVTSNKSSSIYNRKFKPGADYEIEVGFTDDAKDKVTANEYTIWFLDDNKQVLNRIFIEIKEEGDFFINGVKRGKF